KGSYRAGVADLARAVEVQPDSSRYRNQLAWLLATCPRDEYRNGAQAVFHATRAAELTEWQDGNILDTLAAAYAECGRFAEAVQWADKAVELAPPQIKEAVRSHLHLYRAGKPFRTQPPAPASGAGPQAKHFGN